MKRASKDRATEPGRSAPRGAGEPSAEKSGKAGPRTARAGGVGAGPRPGATRRTRSPAGRGAGPSPNGANGRDEAGRFAPGNAGGPGNPYARQVAALRAAMLEAVTPERMTAAVEALLNQAAEGNVPAIRELLDRTLGKPVELDLIERIQALEARLSRKAVPTESGEA